MPKESNPLKVEAMKNLGAIVEFHGLDFDETRLWVEEEAKRKGYRYIHSANEPLLIAGVGPLYLGIMEDLLDVEVIIVPMGGGSGASAACIVAKSINPDVKVFGFRLRRLPQSTSHGRTRKWLKQSLLKPLLRGSLQEFPSNSPLTSSTSSWTTSFS